MTVYGYLPRSGVWLVSAADFVRAVGGVRRTVMPLWGFFPCDQPLPEHLVFGRLVRACGCPHMMASVSRVIVVNL